MILLFCVDTELGIYPRIARVCPNLVEISGDNINIMGLRALGGLSGSCLTSINFNFIKGNESFEDVDASIDILCKGHPKLKKLCFLHPRTHITEAAAQSVARHCPRIKVLCLRDLDDFLDPALTYLAQLQCLREIDLSDACQLTSIGVQGLLKANRKLEVLILSDISETSEELNATFNDAALLRCIGAHCPNLIKLHLRIDTTYSDITTSTDATAASFEAMIQGLPALEEFRIANYTKPNTILLMLGMYCPRLKHVFIDKVACTDNDFARFCHDCPLLESVQLRDLPHITDPSMLAVAAHCPMLKELYISYLGDISDDSLCVLFKQCIHLTSVKLDSIENITNKPILILLKYCPQLRVLSLHNSCYQLIDYCILSIPTHCPHIQTLELSYISTLTHETVIQLSRYCKQLQSLTLYSNKINNNTIITILKNCKNLTYINIQSKNVNSTNEFQSQCNRLIKGRHDVYISREYKEFILQYSRGCVHNWL